MRRFRGTSRLLSREVEHCELCSAELQRDHPHLIELATRELLCSCAACAVLFDGMERLKFKRVPRHVECLPNFELTDAQWDGLMIPINLAFFFRSSLEQRVVALYPSPAGAVESFLSLSTWNAIEERNPILCRMSSDIEALLVNRISRGDQTSAARYFIAPIDECYKLVGLIRANWKGLSGGEDVWEQIGRFFADLRARSAPADGGFDA
jgi:hypothetical protein